MNKCSYCGANCEGEQCWRHKPRKPLKRTRLKVKAHKIPHRSKKRIIEEREYNRKKVIFLAKPENKFCFVEGCCRLGETIEHRKGRKGFADSWARDNKIPLLSDERFFAACCLDHNLEFERNPKLSHKYQLSQIHQGPKTKKP